MAVEPLRRQRATQAADELAGREGTYPSNNLVFADERHPTLDAATKAVGAAVRGLGLHGVILHSCRHYVATLALANGTTYGASQRCWVTTRQR